MMDAALGLTVTVPAIDGEFEMTLKPGVQPGDVKTYRNRGVPALRGHGRGDLKVVVTVLVPRRLSPEQRALLQELAELSLPEDYEEEQQSFFDKVRAAFRP